MSTTGLVRIATAGSVDDGKSTLIGRLLYDSKEILADQLAHIEDVSARRGLDTVDLALLTDGLRSEREQGITIDVAYRYFATPRRSFILADTPGHVQYARNMVTGASTAAVAIVLVAARDGPTEQSRRHTFVASLLGLRHVIFAVNKMDLVDWAEASFDRIVEELTSFTARLNLPDVTFIPISALQGDNVVERGERSPWYGGPPLLWHLEHLHVASDRNLIDVRFPVQWVIRPQTDEHHDYRGYAGQVAGGVLKPGDEVLVLPSGRATSITRIETYDGDLAEAFPPMSVILHLADDLDIARGDLICRPHNHPEPVREIDAMVCGMTEEALRPGARLAMKHTTRTARVVVDELRYRLDVNTLHRDLQAEGLGLNDIGRVRLRTSAPMIVDAYRRNRATGSFILIDETRNDTVAGGMILDAGQS
ncbi:MAG: sulfate adenylyltransferase subunit 1 [Solirubrobacteraceae bacterium]